MDIENIDIGLSLKLSIKELTDFINIHGTETINRNLLPEKPLKKDYLHLAKQIQAVPRAISIKNTSRNISYPGYMLGFITSMKNEEQKVEYEKHITALLDRYDTLSDDERKAFLDTLKTENRHAYDTVALYLRKNISSNRSQVKDELKDLQNKRRLLDEKLEELHNERRLLDAAIVKAQSGAIGGGKGKSGKTKLK